MLHPPPVYRHAAYFAPAPGSLAGDLGAQWLGRCARTGERFAQPVAPDWNAQDFAQATQAPRRYGWHATLKAPFVLARERTAAELEAGFSELSGRCGAPFAVELKLARVGHFLALVPRAPSAALQRVADACVRDLHPLAAPLPPDELARRSRGGLTQRQSELLALWAYPYVMEEFAFHLTLTDALVGLPEARIAQLMDHAQHWFAPLLTQGLQIDAVSWFSEDAPGADFRWVQRFGFAP